MSFGTKDRGEEFIVKHLFTDEVARPASIEVGLYNDSDDALADSADVADITTEPGDTNGGDAGNYARLTYSFGTTEFSSATDSNNDWQAVFAPKTFDLTNTTGVVDGFFAVITYQAENESSANDHLFTTDALRDETGATAAYDLAQQSSGDFDGTFTVQ